MSSAPATQPPPNTTFTQDWFTPRTPFWEEHVQPTLKGRPARWLELGSYEGRSAIWTADNILTHPDSHIDCVDIWAGPYEANFNRNIAAHPRREMFSKHKMPCEEFLASRVAQKTSPSEMYDCVYVDADHQAKSALRDAALAWSLLNTGGFMIFDDYPWEHPKTDPMRHKKLGPKKGIDAFLECWQHELQVLHKQWQVIVQKIPTVP